MNSLHNSFKSHRSMKLGSPWNSSHGGREDQRPILYGNPKEDSEDNQAVIVKIEEGSLEEDVNNGGGSVFSLKSQNLQEMNQDPPSRLISSFIQKQKRSGAEMALDMDLEMEELKKPVENVAQSKNPCVSFQEVSTDPPSRHSEADSEEEEDSDSDEDESELRRISAIVSPTVRDMDGAGVVHCSSNSFFRRRSSMLLRAKTRSRLIDPPLAGNVVTNERKSMRIPNRSGQIPPRSGPRRSGLLSKSFAIDEDDEDPFDDLPDEFNRTKISTWTILQLIGFVLVTASLICSLTIDQIQNKTIWGLDLWKWVVLILVLISGRLLSGWLTRIIVLFLERNFKLRKRLLYFVYGVRNAVQNCIWLGQVLIAWQSLFDKKAERENKALSYITRILFCLIVASVLRLVKTLLLKVLASSFHVSTYFDRIQEAVFNQYVIETLSGPPLIEIQHNMEEEDRLIAEVQKFQNAGATIPNDLKAAALPFKNRRMVSNNGGFIGLKRSSQLGKSSKLSGGLLRADIGRQQEDGITMDQLNKLNQKNVSAWNMKRLMRIVRRGTLTTLDEQITQERGEDESTLQIRSEHEAKMAARKIFNNVAKQGARHIYVVDLMRFMREDEALRTMTLFNGSQDADRVSRRALKNWVINAFRDRRALSLTLNDTKTAVNKLHQMANVVVAIILIALWLLILNITTTHSFVFLSSQALLLVFIFGNTLKTTFEAIIFLFVMHPFDVGDRCEVNGVQMVVEEMNILTTVFLRYDNLKLTYPNSVLATLPISNYYRSPDMGDSVDFCIHVSTSVEKIALMRERILTFMENKKDHWYPGAQVVIKDFEEVNKLLVSLWMRHRINFQDMGLKWTRREPVVQEIIKILRELDIEYRMLPVDMNIRNFPPVASCRLPSTWNTCS